MTASAPLPLRRRLWPKSLAGKAAMIAGAAFFFLAVLWVAAYVVTERKLADAWAYSERLGLSNDPATLFGPPVPESENALLPFRTVIDRAKRQCLLGKEMTRNERVTLDPEKMTAPESLAGDSDYEAAWAEADRRQRFHTLADLSQPLLMVDLTYVSDIRYVTAAELALSRWLTSQDRKEEAAQRLLRYARLIRRWSGTEPTLWAATFSSSTQISLLIELNSLLRRAGRQPPNVHDLIEAEVSRHENVLPAFLIAAQSEKLALAEAYDSHTSYSGITLLKPYSRLDRLFLLNYFNEAMEILTRPPGEMAAAHLQFMGSAAISSKDPWLRFLYPLSTTSVPTVSVLHLQLPQVVALSRCLRVVNAMASKNDFNAELGSMGLPPGCVTDPMDGQPLRVKRAPDGPIVYSIGHNLADDGGALGAPPDKCDIGLGPTSTSQKPAAEP